MRLSAVRLRGFEQMGYQGVIESANGAVVQHAFLRTATWPQPRRCTSRLAPSLVDAIESALIRINLSFDPAFVALLSEINDIGDVPLSIFDRVR